MLDLVALATIADVVPLVDENRALAARGLRTLARTNRPGLQALMRSARVDPAAVDATAVGFRLAPRINAAGRLGRPDVALELLLTDDADEAERLAAELEDLNRERQAVEERILREAVALVESWSPAERQRRGYVLWDETWHEGVNGIVASRLVERYNRPVVLIARSATGWKGSGRSISTFDLHGALGACAGHLERFGGHRAAAGLSIETEQLESFREAFAAHADAVLTDVDLRPVTTIDAIVPARALTLDLAEELDRLAPFGLGNPEPTLLVASVEAVSASTVGEGKHLRFRIRQHERDGGSAIAFGLGRELDRIQRPGRYDVAFRLKENRWNGTVAPQLVVRRVFDAAMTYDELRTWLAEQWRAGEASWTSDARAIFAELGLVGGNGRRELLESGSFRALLERDPVGAARSGVAPPFRLRRRSTRACPGASSARRARRRARSRPCRCPGRRRSAGFSFVEIITTRAVSSPRHVTLCAPSGPGGKQTRSPRPSSISPPSCRTVTRPSRTRSHSSSGYS